MEASKFWYRLGQIAEELDQIPGFTTPRQVIPLLNRAYELRIISIYEYGDLIIQIHPDKNSYQPRKNFYRTTK
tara:strand:+ start:2474 stop:2692 length:219 start_codon:yes stop_codon:yes gene_type:complete